ncbi:hypothetical protein NWF24_02630 [Variovorax paradoxus]|uniref:DUF2946 family protein n=1 Tax=Variovorax paradoxus TaxID=34073 RepID=UPI0021AD30ED|nr:DUF2946 family protein [Variovorax paradoxus]UVH58325.1 hypothetical protein NWF24_02630 [Variovorax paradoxus]
MLAPSLATPNPPAARAGLRCPGVDLIRWVLLWFALSLGAAIASPVVHPQTVELVCSNAGSVKAIVHTDDGAQEMGAGHMDCPLCVLNGAPPATTPIVELPALMPLARAVQPIPSAHIAAVTAAPLPARGPPSLS